MPEPLAFDHPIPVGRPNVGDRDRFLAMVGDALDRRWLSNDGPFVRELEQRIATRAGVAHCVAMCNGTVALEVAIRALGLAGEVIVPSYTFVATAHVLQWLGITPVFADIDPHTHQLDPASVESMITPRTTGILAVHLWGRAAPVAALQQIADRHGLSLFFDAAHAFDCMFDGRWVGSFGRAEVLSFHATKFFNTIEGGAVLTNDDDLAHRMRLMRNFGFAGEDTVVDVGTNGKMNEICAAMGLTNLEVIEDITAVNRRNAEAYTAVVNAIPGLRLLPFDPAARNNFQYIVLEVESGSPEERDRIVQHLRNNNVLARKYFWPSVHRMQPYRDLHPHAGLLLPHTEQVADRVVVLPSGTAVAPEDIEIIGKLLRVASGHHG
ncbi:DegT/DnrJ/EryC1/StrS aminotransferase family protein [Knoellia sp. p5-6-4]|uniref:DegT/DnrJ/EryC1/StrS family aminotransferase n=1 Tax=unclassified Knoellia TaxID=2618719 RepID=UPI0023DA5FA7|nr:DegT/DnrJ/EryC1/StrS family aminotransferase [Knoellia sp. p5-6-4]MDF2146606.1 DegT/DnrJ/EryC1/StrS family aminotransferase [Knoellia sp. p5-6-4]